VVAASVTRRRREIGIRMALGADAARVRHLVLHHAAAITVPGLGLGLAGAWVASRSMEALLFGVRPHDPVAYAGTAALFVGVGLLAAWLPAERATRVDTVETLSVE
jgi:ABC-type antimicrobial peptide transport system permease subunit